MNPHNDAKLLHGTYGREKALFVAASRTSLFGPSAYILEKLAPPYRGEYVQRSKHAPPSHYWVEVVHAIERM